MLRALLRMVCAGPRRLRVPVTVIALAIQPAGVAAQDIAVPVEVQLPLFLKILAFDRNLTGRPAGPLVMGVLYQGNFRLSAQVAQQVRRLAKEGGADVRIVMIDLDGSPDLTALLSREPAHVLYVCPLRAIDLKTVSSVSRPAGVRTLTGVPRYVEEGLGLGLDLKGERPEIVVNLAAFRAEGGDLDAQLLKLARVVR